MTVNIRAVDAATLVGIETVEDTAATLAASDVIYMTDVSFSKGETLIDRDFRNASRPTDKKKQAVQEWWDISGTVPYAYSGTAGTSSALESIFLMCGAAQTVDAGVSVTYEREISSLFDSATWDMRTPHEDQCFDHQHLATACRGQLGFKIAVGEDITFDVSGIGNYHEPTRVSNITPNFGNQKTNIVGAPTPSLIALKTLNSETICLTSVEATNFFGYAINYVEDMCRKGARGVDTDPGQLKIQMTMPDWVSEFNPWALADRTTLSTVPFAITVGTTAGQVLQIEVDEVQVGSPVEVTLDGGMLGMELTLDIIDGARIIEA